MVAFDLKRRVFNSISPSRALRGVVSRTSKSQKKLSLGVILYSRISLVFFRLRVPVTLVLKRNLHYVKKRRHEAGGRRW